MSAAPRVLLVTGETFAPGGIQRFNRTLLAALRELGCSVTLLTLNESVAPDGAADPAAGDATGRGRGGALVVRTFGRRRLRFAAATARAVLAGRHDVVIVGHIRYATLVDAALRMRVTGRPHCLLAAHGLEVWDRIRPAQHSALRRLDAILCVSDYTRASLLAQVPGLDPARALRFPNALGEEWKLPRDSERGGEASAPFLLSVSRLDPREREKGLTTCLEAVAALPPEVRYVIAGDGPDRGFLERCAARLGIRDRVVFTGRVDDAELTRLYRECAAFVLPSAQEGFGIVFLEAMAFGAPVVAAAEKGALDVIVPERSGLLVRFGDVPALTAALCRVLQDRGLRERLRAGGRAAVTGDGPFTATAFRGRVAALPGIACHEAEAASP